MSANGTKQTYYDRATVFAQLGVFREPVGWFGQAALALNPPLIICRQYWKSVSRSSSTSTN
jgi:hypothetical protein